MADKKPMMVSPLYETGVGHAKVNTPQPTSFPDPLGYLKFCGGASEKTSGSGDDVNEWKDLGPSDGRS